MRMREGEPTRQVPVQSWRGSPGADAARSKPSPIADVAWDSPVPVQIPSVGEPTWEAMSSLDMSIWQHFIVGPSSGQAAKEALESRSTDVARASPVAVQMWKERKGRAPSLRAGPIPVQMWDR